MNLSESARLRNLVVHANWESMNEDGYAYTKLKTENKKMYQEYIQFDTVSLEKIILLILKTQKLLHDFWEKRNEAIY